MKRFAALLLTCVLSASALAAKDVLPVRLPSGVTPTAYRLALNVDPNQLLHSGEVTISVSITQPGTVIRLNAAEIMTAASAASGRSRVRPGATTSRTTMHSAPTTPVS